ncbi:50S ribosome-binding GTPase [Candidatus Woesearchaeota archaeon]|nr:50S ribosome-binding GTPase [Candidatus Woesearchaeota archaeon]
MVKIDERIKDLEKDLSSGKYDKSTAHHFALVKAQLSKLKERKEKQASSGKGVYGYSVRKSGDASVILVGFPSVGKSTLMNKLTDAKSDVAAYAFTTLTVIPGVMKYKSAKIQILDVPGIVEGAASGKGKGKEVLSCVYSADLIILLADEPSQIKKLERELYEFNIRINTERARINLVRKEKGGLNINLPKNFNLDMETIKLILREFKIHNANVDIYRNLSVEEFIDFLEGNKKYIPAIYVLNKVDKMKKEELEKIKGFDLFISAETDFNLDKLRDLIFNKLNFIRVYCKEMRKEADLNEPMIMFKDATLRDMCSKLHKDFIEKFKFSRVWGVSVKHQGQKIMKLEHKLKDKDIVELHMG